MSDYLAEQYRELHRLKPEYSATCSRGIAKFILGVLEKARFAPESILNFGCGKSTVLDIIAGPMARKGLYDFAIEGRDVWPEGIFDLLISTDVFEHIPEDEIPSTIAMTTEKALSFIHLVHFRRASTILPDGQNAHATQKPAEWWLEMFQKHTKLPMPVVHVPSEHPAKGWFISLPQNGS